MAVVKVPQNAKLVLSVQNGVNAAGKPVYKQQTYANVKPDAADTDVYAVGQGLAGLQQEPVAAIARLDDSNLVSQ